MMTARRPRPPLQCRTTTWPRSEFNQESRLLQILHNRSRGGARCSGHPKSMTFWLLARCRSSLGSEIFMTLGKKLKLIYTSLMYTNFYSWWLNFTISHCQTATNNFCSQSNVYFHNDKSLVNLMKFSQTQIKVSSV